MLLFGSQLRSYRDLPIRYAESSTLHRNELAGALHGLAARPHVTQDDAHIFCTRGADRTTRSTAASTSSSTSTRSSASSPARGALDPAGEQARHRRGVGLRPRGSCRPRARAPRDRVRRRRGRGNVLRAEDRPAHDRTCSAARGRWGRSSWTRRCRSGSGSPTWAPDNVEHTPFVIHRALLGSLERFIGILIEHYGGAFPFWLAPVQVRLIPVGEQHREAVHELRRRARGGGLPRRRRRARRHARQADPRRRAREGAVHDRLRRPRVGCVARGARAGRRAVDAEPRGTARTVPRRDCYDPALKEGADHCPSPSRAEQLARVQPSRLDEEKWPLRAAVFVVHKEDSTSLVKSL